MIQTIQLSLGGDLSLPKNIWTQFEPLLEQYTVAQIAESIAVNRNTVQRWIQKREVPHFYQFDLFRMTGETPDYSLYDEKDLDQFFTPAVTAQLCVDRTVAHLQSLGETVEDYHWIEPSAGAGAFYDCFPADSKTALDVVPQRDGILAQDFLTWQPTTTHNLVCGNPPFGLRGHLALKFINHAATFADHVSFIVPQLFESSGKGNCRDRVQGLNLTLSESCPTKFQFPNGKSTTVNCIHQIWSKHYPSIISKIDLSHLLKLYSLSDGGDPSSTRNLHMIDKCDYYLPSTVFGADKMRLYPSFEDLPQRRGIGIVMLQPSDAPSRVDWAAAAFTSTNGALNLNFETVQRAINDAL